jgi:aldehyde dehydrogenase (NAD+)
MRFEYGSAPEGGSRITLRGSYGLFIGGEFVSGSSVFKTISPATEEVLAEVTHGTTEDVDRGVAAARLAYERTWSMMPGKDRAKYLLRIARRLKERAGELAVLESLDSGKPIRQTRDVDLPLAIAHFYYHAGWADKLAYAGFVGNAAFSARPLGVVGQVMPVQANLRNEASVRRAVARLPAFAQPRGPVGAGRQEFPVVEVVGSHPTRRADLAR